MTNVQLFISALYQSWYLWLPIILLIVWTGFYEAVENKWEARSNGK